MRNLKTYFPIRSGLMGQNVSWLKAVDDVSLTVRPGETIGVVGESGCGKSSLARSLLRLATPQSGEILFEGENVLTASRSRMIALRRQMQMIFQDPFSSLDPNMTVQAIIEKGLVINGVPRAERRERVCSLIEVVGLNKAHLDRYPHEFSGGQRQRIGIARALALRPKLIVADEPVSALDVSVQAQVLNLLRDVQQEFGLTYVFIAHDLAVVEYISDRVAVMYLGRIVELARSEDLFKDPRVPYTQALLSAVPRPHRAQDRAHHPEGRCSEPGESAFRLPIPHALPARDGCLRGRAARFAGGPAEPPRGVPFRRLNDAIPIAGRQ